VNGESIEILGWVVPLSEVTKPPSEAGKLLAQPPSEVSKPLSKLPSDLHNPLHNSLHNPPCVKGPEKIFVIWSDYARLTGGDKKRSRRSLYNDLHSGKLLIPVRPVSRGNKKRYYCVEVTDPKLIEKARLLGIRDMTPMVYGKEELSPADDLTFTKLVSHAQPPLNHVSSHAQPPLDHVPCHHLNPQFDLVPDRKGFKKTPLALPEYIEVTGNDQKKSRRTFYRHLHSGKLGFTVWPIYQGRRKRYFVEVDDPEMIKKVRFRKVAQEIVKGKKTICIYIKVPERVLRKVNKISSPESTAYNRFYEFINKEPENILPIKIVFHPVKYFKKRIRIQKEDYQKILQIAEANGLSVGKVITTFLESYMTPNIESPSTETKTNIGG